MNPLQDRLLELRRKKPDVTNADLARAAGVKPSSVVEWFNGDTKALKLKSALAVATLYGVTVHWVSTGKGPKKPSGWPFTAELGAVVAELDAKGLWFAENALRNQLQMDPLPKPLGEFGKNAGQHDQQQAA